MAGIVRRSSRQQFAQPRVFMQAGSLVVALVEIMHEGEGTLEGTVPWL